jgi:hypothetical protein
LPVQLNLLSVVGYYGLKSIKNMEQLLRKECTAMWVLMCTNNHIAAFEQKGETERFGALKEAIANNQFFKSE